MGKSSPKAPDPVATANAQAAANKDAAVASQTLSMVDQYTPQGSLTYSQLPGTGQQTTFDQAGYDKAMSDWNNRPTQTGPTSDEGFITNAGGSAGNAPTRDQFTTTTDGTPRYRADVAYSPEQQALYDSSTRAQTQFGQIANNQLGQLAGSLANPYEYNGQARQMSINTNGMAPMTSSVGGPQFSGSMGGGVPAGANAGSLPPGAQGMRPRDPLPQQQAAQQPASRNPGVRYDIANAGPIATQIADAGAIQRQIASAGEIQRQLGDAGQITNNIGDAGAVNRSLDFSRYGDLNITRDSVQQALLDRLQPSLTSDRAALETQLANQGLTPGTPAYDRAIDAANRQSNDARLAAIAQAGTEQSRLFGLGLSDAQFQNSAQNQVFGQEATRAGFQNQAQQQNFGQIFDRGNFANSAQSQQYGQNANDATFANAAQAQQFGQNATQAAFQNSAQAQQYGQNANDASFFNTAQGQQFGQDFSNAQLGNATRAQQFNEALASAQFGNSARDQQIAQDLALRGQPLNEIAALLSGSQVSMPQFVNTPTAGVQAPDIAGLTMANYQNQLDQSNAQTQGLFGLLGSGLGAAATFWSDRRLKRDITRIGKLPNGLGVYSYRYTWSNEPEVGLLADEVAAVRPWAVERVGSHDMVNYAEAMQ